MWRSSISFDLDLAPLLQFVARFKVADALTLSRLADISSRIVASQTIISDILTLDRHYRLAECLAIFAMTHDLLASQDGKSLGIDQEIKLDANKTKSAAVHVMPESYWPAPVVAL